MINIAPAGSSLPAAGRLQGFTDALADGIQAGEYHLIKARGAYNAADRTLQATLILAMLKP